MPHQKFIQRLLLLCIALIGLVLSLSLYEELAYRYKRSLHLASLAAALSVYADRYGVLPDALDAIEATGLYGCWPYRAPLSGWKSEPSGPPPFYLPAELRDDVSFIVAVEEAAVEVKEAEARLAEAEDAHLQAGWKSVQYGDGDELELLRLDARVKHAKARVSGATSKLADLKNWVNW